MALASVLMLIVSLLTHTGPVFAQAGQGDQFLDGIGETALIARYVLNGNVEDWSRNNYHATLHGTEATYVKDSMFGSVLSLPGGRNGNYVQIPGQALIGVDTISITGWAYINYASRRARFFDFGRSRTVSFSCAVTGRNAAEGYRVRITNEGRRAEQGPLAPSIPTDQWVHIAIVLDTTKQTLSSYCDAVRIGFAPDVTLSLKQVLNQENAAANLLYIGRGQFEGSEINAKFHDFRIYNIALTEEQVKTIRNNALSDEVRVNKDLEFINLGTLTGRITDLTLPTEGPTGSTITWDSNQPQFVSTTGKVTRPPYTYSKTHATVRLTAKTALNQARSRKDFIVTVPRMPSDKEVVASDKETLNLGELSALTEDINLPDKGIIGASISWSSDNTKAISTAGRVNRSAPGTGNARVKLTATLTYGKVTDTKTFEATVLAMPTDRQIVDSDIAQIHLPDLNDVTENLALPTDSASGISVISWSSSNEDIISNSGVVMQPMFKEGSKSVVLTVTATKGDTTATKKLTAVVRRLPNAPILVDVPDITAETLVGHLPNLPFYIPGRYRNDVKGPLVRVNWPAPTDNSQVTKPGTYTVTGTVPDTTFQPKAAVTVKAAPPDTDKDTNLIAQRNVEPFPLGDVVLNKDEKGRDTQFIKNRNKFITTLANTNPDSFLYNFRDAFGQKQAEGVRPLGVWDSRTTRLRGHASGHYLSAIAQAYASTTYDKNLRANFKQKMDYLINTLYELSQKSGTPAKQGGKFNADPTAVPPGPGKNGYDSDLSAEGIRTDYWNWGKGFISAYPPDQFIMLEMGATYGGRNNQIWAPYYTLHKILAGLLDCYEVGGNEKALEIAKGMGIWVYQRLKVVPTSTRISMWNRYIAGEYGGMNEVMARLYRITSDKRFLECAQLFDNISFFFGDAEHTHGLAKNVDTIRGKHANQHIPQITGSLETYKGTKDIQYYQVAKNFWNMCKHCYMYNIGGVGGAKNPNNSECFTAQPNTLFTNGFNSGGQNETCATYNMLKLSRQLFMFDQDARYMDYYEQALYNHILASVAENNAGNTYHVPLNPGAQRQFSNANMTGFTCCNGTALESNTKLQDSIYFKSTDNKTLYVNLYVPSTVTWTERNVVVKQMTNYPYDDNTRLTIKGGGAFDIKVRIPHWAIKGFFVKINGKDQQVEARPGTYLSLSRTWKDGDTIELKMPFHFYLRKVMDKPNIASIFYGPVLLAAEEPTTLSTWRAVSLDAGDIGESITGDPSTLRFNINGVNFKPFYETYDRYSVYLNVTLD